MWVWLHYFSKLDAHNSKFNKGPADNLSRFDTYCMYKNLNSWLMIVMQYLVRSSVTVLVDVFTQAALKFLIRLCEIVQYVCNHNQ